MICIFDGICQYFEVATQEYEFAVSFAGTNTEYIAILKILGIEDLTAIQPHLAGADVISAGMLLSA